MNTEAQGKFQEEDYMWQMEASLEGSRQWQLEQLGEKHLIRCIYSIKDVEEGRAT